MATAKPERQAEDSNETLATTAYKRLEVMLVTLQLPPNSLLSEDELSRELQIGRTPVREALKRLAIDGLVKILPRRGVVVTEIDAEHQLLMLEVRREIERLVARRAAALSNKEEKELFAQMAEDIEEAGKSDDRAQYIRLDKEFNDFVVRAARNPVAEQMLAPMHSRMRRFWYNYYRHHKDLPLAWEQHANVMRAIAAGDESRAAAASDSLMDWVEEVTRSAIPAEMI